MYYKSFYTCTNKMNEEVDSVMCDSSETMLRVIDYSLTNVSFMFDNLFYYCVNMFSCRIWMTYDV